MDDFDAKINIKVVGVGGGGCNAVGNMVGRISDDIQCYVLNTDQQSLQHCKCKNQLLLGEYITNGFGAGMNYEIGARAAEESYDQIKELLKDADLVFIAAGEGGGTGTGACPVVARACKENGSLVIAIVTRPFNFEGESRNNNATEGIKRLKDVVDSYIVISNDKLMIEAGSIPLLNMFKQADDVLCNSVSKISDIILKNGLINLDFADVSTILKGKGLTMIGFGQASGSNRALDAATQALNSPFLENTINGAKNFLIQFTGSSDITINEIYVAVEYITQMAKGEENRNVNTIFGAAVSEDLEDTIQVTIIASNFDDTVVEDQPLVDPPTIIIQAPQIKQVVDNMQTTLAQSAKVDSSIATKLMNEKEKSKKTSDTIKQDIEAKNTSSILPSFLKKHLKDKKKDKENNGD